MNINTFLALPKRRLSFVLLLFSARRPTPRSTWWPVNPNGRRSRRRSAATA